MTIACVIDWMDEEHTMPADPDVAKLRVSLGRTYQIEWWQPDWGKPN